MGDLVSNSQVSCGSDGDDGRDLQEGLLPLPFNLGEVWSLFFPVNIEVEPTLTGVYCCNIF